MRKFLYGSCAVFALAGIVWQTQSNIADAQPAPMAVAQAPAPGAGAPMPPDGDRPRPEMRGGPGMMPPGMMRAEMMRPGMPPEMMQRWRIGMMMRTWGLFAPVRDKKLTVDDVKILAEAILLRHGNHDWTVIDVGQNPDSSIGFAFAAADGKSVIARFAMDPQTGRLRRVG